MVGRKNDPRPPTHVLVLEDCLLGHLSRRRREQPPIHIYGLSYGNTFSITTCFSVSSDRKHPGTPFFFRIVWLWCLHLQAFNKEEASRYEVTVAWMVCHLDRCNKHESSAIVSSSSAHSSDIPPRLTCGYLFISSCHSHISCDSYVCSRVGAIYQIIYRIFNTTHKHGRG